jgi:rSAM/selenodomain-associated transferase 1
MREQKKFMPESDTALIIMARYPEPGKTKTRLARTLGDAEVAQLYQAFLTDLAQRLGGQDYTLLWAYTPPEIDYATFVQTLAPAYSQRCFPQQGQDFGTRLLSAFQWAHEHGFQRVLLIGSDSPHISHAIIEQARVALDAADVVLGPSDDGGYYLIAMRHPYDVFSGIPMSTDVVTEMTLALAQQQGLTTHLIDQLYDIDELPDLLRLAELLAVDKSQAPATAAYLTTMRSLYDYHTHLDAATFDLHRTDQPL